MSMVTTEDGTEIDYKDWGEGPAVTLSHGWPLSADGWDGQMLLLAQHGFRLIAQDRRRPRPLRAGAFGKAISRKGEPS